MAFEWGAVAKFFRPGLPLYYGATIAAGAIIYLPDEIAKSVGVSNFRTEQSEYVGSIFILSLSLAICYSIGANKRPIDKYLKIFMHDFGFMRRFKKLKHEEKAVLAWALERESRSFYADIRSPLIQGLRDSGYLSEPVVVSGYRGGHFYKIDYEIWGPMQKHRKKIRNSVDPNEPVTSELWDMLDRRG